MTGKLDKMKNVCLQSLFMVSCCEIYIRNVTLVYPSDDGDYADLRLMSEKQVCDNEISMFLESKV